jgi:hypothetical protein
MHNITTVPQYQSMLLSYKLCNIMCVTRISFLANKGSILSSFQKFLGEYWTVSPEKKSFILQNLLNLLCCLCMKLLTVLPSRNNLVLYVAYKLLIAHFPLKNNDGTFSAYECKRTTPLLEVSSLFSYAESSSRLFLNVGCIQSLEKFESDQFINTIYEVSETGIIPLPY